MKKIFLSLGILAGTSFANADSIKHANCSLNISFLENYNLMQLLDENELANLKSDLIQMGYRQIKVLDTNKHNGVPKDELLLSVQVNKHASDHLSSGKIGARFSKELILTDKPGDLIAKPLFYKSKTGEGCVIGPVCRSKAKGKLKNWLEKIKEIMPGCEVH